MLEVKKLLAKNEKLLSFQNFLFFLKFFERGQKQTREEGGRGGGGNTKI